MNAALANQAPRGPVVGPGPGAAAPPIDAGQGQWFYGLLFALALTGYPLAGSITTILSIEGSLVSYIFRGLVVLFSLLILGRALLRNVLLPIPLPLLLFFFFYLIRLFADAFIRGLYEADYALMFFVGICLVPAIALTSTAAFYRERVVASFLLLVAGTGSVSILVLNNIGVAADASYFEETRRLSFAALNAITVGYTGLFTILAAAILWPGSTRGIRIALAVLIVVGAVLLIQAASRGPLVAGCACVAAVALVRRKWYVFVIFLLAAAYGAAYADANDLAIIERFRDIAGERSANERLLLQAISIEQALASPVLGHAYAETITYYYPHNLLIESALALGMGGLALMLYLQVKFLLFVRELLARGYLLLPLLLLCALVNAQLSSALWSAVDLWIAGGIAFVTIRHIRRLEAIDKTGLSGAAPRPAAAAEPVAFPARL